MIEQSYRRVLSEAGKEALIAGSYSGLVGLFYRNGINSQVQLHPAAMICKGTALGAIEGVAFSFFSRFPSLKKNKAFLNAVTCVLFESAALWCLGANSKAIAYSIGKQIACHTLISLVAAYAAKKFPETSGLMPLAEFISRGCTAAYFSSLWPNRPLAILSSFRQSFFYFREFYAQVDSQTKDSPVGISRSGKLEREQRGNNTSQVSNLYSSESLDPEAERLVSVALESMEWRLWQTIPPELLDHVDLQFFTCPILGKPMRFAVKPKSTGGVCYDRDALQSWKINNPGINPPQWPTYIGSIDDEEIEESSDAQFVIDGILLKICTNRLIALIGPEESDPNFKPNRIAFWKLIVKDFSPEEFAGKSSEIREMLILKLSRYVENIDALRLHDPSQAFANQVHLELTKVQKQLNSIDTLQKSAS